ncbi:MAG: bifunctional oligoribonuclease/PAP phosphatase NrnA [Balneolaceae bacterium]
MFQDFRKKLVQFKRVGIYSHIRPDGDCIGAQVGLSLWLEKNGVEAWAFNDDSIPQNLSWLTNYHPIRLPEINLVEKCDAFILIDGNAASRFGSYEKIQSDGHKPSFMIDHHPDPQSDFDYSVSVETASSTCELIYRLFQEHDPGQIDEKVAKALYTGIITDTGSLQYDSVTPETMEAAADLLRRGNFRPNEVAEKVFSNRTPRELHLLSRAMSTIRLYENNQIAVMYVTQEMMDATGTSNEDCEGFVNYPLSIAGIKAAILLKDLDDHGIKMSLRSRSQVDVNKWAREIGGGGHKKAAGAWHPGPLKKTIEEVVQIGSKQIKEIEEQKVPAK